MACNDLAVEPLNEAAVREARLIAVHLPMHTATRLAAGLAPRLRALAPGAHLCFFGLYAPMNAEYLRALGGDSVLGAEFEAALVATYRAVTGGHADAVATASALHYPFAGTLQAEGFELESGAAFKVVEEKIGHYRIGGASLGEIKDLLAAGGIDCRH